MFSNKKRKSVSSSQQTISKFFKSSATSEKKPVKKIPVICILDDEDDITVSNKKITKTDTVTVETIKKESFTDENNKANNSSKAKLKPSIEKLKQYKIESTQSVEKKNNDEAYETALKAITKNQNQDLNIDTLNKFNNTKQFTKVESTKKVNYTPLEKQFVEIRKENEDVILLVECGYKYRFFGTDAEIAAKELNIYCHLDHNFQTASIPVHRLHVHIGRLVAKGYKVGVVEQTETAALKAAGDNKNAPFSRKLKQVYTKATYIDNPDCEGYYIITITSQQRNLTKGDICIIAVNLSTGKIIYHTIDVNDHLNLQFDTLFHVLQPTEIILPKKNSLPQIEKYITQYKKNNVLTRIEKVDSSLNNNSEEYQMILNKFGNDNIFMSFALLHAYLHRYNLESILTSFSNYEVFSKQNNSMRLDYSTFVNLELFENNINKHVKGSILWIIDHTLTIFGKRLLKNWLRQPLIDVTKINDRLDAVTELVEYHSLPCIKSVTSAFHFLPDLEKGLTNIQHHKIKPEKFINIIENIEKLKNLFLSHKSEIVNNFKSPLIQSIYKNIPQVLGDKLSIVLKKLNKKEANSENKINLFQNLDQYPNLFNLHNAISSIEKSLEAHRNKVICKTLLNKSIEYKTVSGLEYLIEVRNSQVKTIPTDWLKISSTKQMSRFRTPFVDEKLKLLCQKREELVIESNKTWEEFLNDFSLDIPDTLTAVKHISTFDCLLSLAKVAQQNGYTQPTFVTNEEMIEIKDGRHPVIEAVLSEEQQYVPNNIYLHNDNKAMLISGPNMGGKSSYIKQIAVTCILAQIGSYIPASSGKLSIIDGVYTRMGAQDNMCSGKSTLMVELEEAAHIMKHATSNSLVILDELGRGTSTHDGTAIAYATLKHFIEDIKSFTLFVTHYPMLAEFQTIYPTLIKNYHMAYINTSIVDEIGNSTIQEKKKDPGEYNEMKEKPTVTNTADIITFLYKLKEGVASKSYGLNVARLAGLSTDILIKASLKSNELQENTLCKGSKLHQMQNIFLQAGSEGILKLIDQLPR